MIWVGNAVGIGDVRNAYRILIGKTERKINMCKITLKVTECEVGKWIRLAQYDVQ
jgi:hypothetical protein